MAVLNEPARDVVPPDVPRFLAGGGDMGARIRAHDWSATPLGPPSGWPQALRSALDICLHSSFPTAIYWGPELRLLYNDAWSAIPAEKHPWALGRAAHEVWADIWHVIEPQLRQVLDTGHGFSTFDELLPMERGGRVHETYWSYTFTPIRDENGSVIGVFNQGHETTAKVIGERERQAEVARLRELFQQAPGAVALLRGPDHVFELVNLAYQQLIGHRDVVGKPVGTALPEIAEQGFIELLDAVYRTGEAYVGTSVSVQLQRTSELPTEKRVLDFVVQPIRGAGGGVTGIFVQATDVTERVRAEAALRESELRLRMVTDHLPALISYVDRNGHYRFGNAAYRHWFGLSPQDLIGRHMRQVLGDTVYNQRRPYLDVVLRGELVRFEGPAMHRTLGLRTCELTYIPDRDKREAVVGFYVMAQDITERKQAEEALHQNAQRWAFIAESASALLAVDRPTAFLDRVYERLASLLGLEIYVQYTVVPARTHLELAACRGLDERQRRAITRLEFGEAVCGKVAQRCEPIIVDNVQASIDESTKLIRSLGITRYLCHPLLGRGGALMGTLSFGARNGTRFDESEVALIRTVCDEVATAMERERAELALREETRTLETLNGIGKVVAAELDLERAVQVVTDAATELSGAAFGAFFHNKRDPSGRGFALYTLSGAARDAFARFPLVRPTALLGATLERGEIVRADDITTDPRYGRNAPGSGMPQGHLPVRSYMAVPVTSRSGEVHGGLLFGHPQPGVFTERVERLVAGIASQAAIAIDNAHLYQEAQQEIARREQTEEALREADRRKDEFLATLSHELRNPLAPIRQAAALSKMPGATSAQLLWSRDVIERQVGHMAHLLDDLLDISRITRGRLELRIERIELGAVIESAIETARPLIDVRGHKLTVEIPAERIYFNADRIRVVQIISNLLTNAAKYTDTAGRIELRSHVLDGQVLISVRDTGIGIAAEMLPRLFEMFSQAESTLDRAEGGLGIGLALVRGLVELHGGTVEAQSEGLGRGSEFIVRLPLTVPAPASASDMTEVNMEASPGTSGLKILVADDNVDSAESLAILLQLHGHEVKTAYSGRAALDLAATFHPHVALLDIGMPELNGYETAERIRAQPWGQRITLVAISGWGQEDDKHRASAAGFDRHLTKPVDPEVVAALLAELS